MKRIDKYLNESKTDIKAIRNYGKSWTTEQMPIDFEEMIKNFLEGTLEGLEENERAYRDSESDIATIEADTKLVSKLLETIDNPISWK